MPYVEVCRHFSESRVAGLSGADSLAERRPDCFPPRRMRGPISAHPCQRLLVSLLFCPYPWERLLTYWFNFRPFLSLKIKTANLKYKKVTFQRYHEGSRYNCWRVPLAAAVAGADSGPERCPSAHSRPCAHCQDRAGSRPACAAQRGTGSSRVPAGGPHERRLFGDPFPWGAGCGTARGQEAEITGPRVQLGFPAPHLLS